MAGVGISGDTVEVSPYTTGGNGTQIDPQVTNSQAFVTVNGTPMVIQGDSVAEHVLWDTGPFGGSFILDTHGGVTMNTSQTFVTINGVPIATNGDPANCDPGHTLTATTPFVDIS